MNSNTNQSCFANKSYGPPSLTMSVNTRQDIPADADQFLKALIEVMRGLYASPNAPAVAVPVRSSRQDVAIRMSAERTFAPASTGDIRQFILTD